MHVHNLYKDGKGIFHYIDQLEELPFREMLDTETVDLLFISLHGSREVSTTVQNIVGDEEVTEDNLKAVASMLHGLYFKKWVNLYNIYARELELETYNLTTTETIDDDGKTSSDTNDSTTTTRQTGVAGYNSEDFANDEEESLKDEATGERTGTSQNERTRETQVKGNTDNLIDDRNKAINALKYNLLQDTIFKDVNQFVGTLIY